MKFVTRFGCEKVRVLEFVKNRGKGGAVRMVCNTRLLSVLKNSILKMSTLCCALLFQQCFKRIVLLFLVKGCLSTRGERILFLDADGATRIADIEKVEKAMDGLTKNDAVHVGHFFPCLLISLF